MSRATLLVAIALCACKGEERETKVERPRPTANESVESNASVVATAAPQASPAIAPSRPRYLRANAQGVLIDAYLFPSVPAFMVEKEVQTVSTRRGAAAILHRFGVNPPADRGGEAWIAKASLVDRLERERLLVVSFRGDVDEEGMRSEDDWLVFLGSTDDDRLISLGSAGISAKTHDGAPVSIDVRPLHASEVDDVVATWSSCTAASTKSCHGLRAWTMARGHPEKIIDVTADGEPTIATNDAPPHDVTIDGRVLTFDAQTFSYH